MATAGTQITSDEIKEGEIKLSSGISKAWDRSCNEQKQVINYTGKLAAFLV